VPKLTFIGFDVEGDGSYADIEVGGVHKPAEIQTIMTETNDCIDDKPYYYRDVVLKVFADPCDNKVSFTMDTDFTAKADASYTINVKYFKVKINGETVCESEWAEIPKDIEFHNGDLVKICGIVRKKTSIPAQFIFGGYTKEEIVSSKDPEDEQYVEQIIVEE
jgi:hypothetical protein